MKSDSKKRPKLKGKRPKPLERKVADHLVKQHEINDKLREKKINSKFLDLF
tara:strand:+ start:786 stop:938 length:153 start_codon:yes stop_codon:yes gene_type:complete